jgi:hypothetical protein
MVQEDRQFVFNSYLRSFRKSRHAGPIPYCLHYDVYRSAMEFFLAQPDTEVWVCTADSGTILGYAVVSKQPGQLPCVHYAYTKELFRRKGVMKACLRAAGIDLQHPAEYSHKTDDLVWLSRKYPKLRYALVAAKYQGRGLD